MSDNNSSVYKEILKFCIPLFRFQNQTYKLFATGTLVNTGNANYIITASHVIEGVEDDDIHILLPNNEMTPYEGTVAYEYEPSAPSKINFDVGIMKLKNEMIDTIINSDKHFLHVNVPLDKANQHFYENCLVSGFPASGLKYNKPKGKIKINSQHLYGKRAFNNTKSINNYNTSFIEIPFKNLDPKPKGMKDCDGMSGGPIFDFKNPEPGSKVDEIRFAGIFTRIDKRNKNLIGVDLSIIKNTLHGVEKHLLSSRGDIFTQ